MKSSSALAVVLAIGTCRPTVDDTCPEPAACAVATAEVRVATRAASDSVARLVEAFDDVGVDPVLFRKLNSKAEEAYAPWGLDDEAEGVVVNPLYEASGASGDNPLFEAQGLIAAVTGDLGRLAGGASAAEHAAHRDRAAAWQGWFASVAATPQEDDAWSAPAVRAALATTRVDLGATRCVLASLAVGVDEGLDVCTTAADLLATTALLDGTREVVEALAREEAARQAGLIAVRDAARAYADAVVAVFGEGDAADAADALVDVVDAAIADAGAPELAALRDVLAAEVPALDRLMDDVRVALREATLHTAAHEAAHVVQQRSGSLDQVFAQDGGLADCAGEGLDCLLSMVAARAHGLHRGHDLPSIEASAQAAFDLAADKEPIPERRAALREALRVERGRESDASAGKGAAERQYQTLSNASKSRHDTAKNSVGNIR